MSAEQLFNACENGDIITIEFLLLNHKSLLYDICDVYKSYGSDYVRNGEHTFMLACRHGHIKIIEMLLTLGINQKDVIDRNNNANNQRKFSKIDIHFNNDIAFREAVANHHDDVVELLLSLASSKGKHYKRKNSPFNVGIVSKEDYDRYYPKFERYRKRYILGWNRGRYIE